MIAKRATSVAFFILSFFVQGLLTTACAQEAVYRCGAEYTNDGIRAKREKCRLLEGGGAVVTIPAPGRIAQPAKAKAAAPRSTEQRTRDDDAKAIIESELKKTEAQLVDLRQQYARLSSAQDTDRKLALKQQMARAEADVISLKRELRP